ncbi:hypothetical protein FRC04_008353 [Tulasnella sp. 424]|nr:hypothetical protein FRC04_008353 [Tulasnella sp. 424]KAG8964791.1 hypothetical protein FRC05_003581 [Tulasnella sp. 425]
MAPCRTKNENSQSLLHSTPKASTTRRPPLQDLPLNSTPIRTNALPDLASLSSSKRHTIHVNGFVQTPTPPSYKPYASASASRSKKLGRVLESPVPRRSQPGTDPPPPTPSPSIDLWKSAEEKLLGPGKSFRPFQKEGTEALLQGKDVTVVVSTGMGKSILFVLPIVIRSRGISLVVTPLRSLAKEQVKELNKRGLPSIFVTRTKDNGPLPINDIVEGRYRVVFCCPEMLECPTFAPILHSPNFLRQLTHTVIDEAHCIVEMGLYRPSYKRLNLLRPTLQSLKFNIPILQLSATLPSHYLKETNHTLGIDSNSLLINLGNFRSELSTVVLQLHPNSKAQVARLVFAPLEFPDLEPPQTRESNLLPKVIVYVDDIGLITSLVWFLRDELAKRGLSKDLVEPLHASLSEEHIDHVLQEFATSDSTVRILVASEILGCGSNSKGVRRVIQYRCSGLTLSQLCQRFGRGARDGGRSVGYLLHEKRLAPGGKLAPETPGTEDVGMLRLVQENTCCDIVFDWYFKNPPRLSDPQRICCNRCHPHLSPIYWTWITEEPSLGSMKEGEPVVLTKKEKDAIYLRMETWRYMRWNIEWQNRWKRWGPEDILTDADLSSITNNAEKIHSIEEMRRYTGLVHWDELSKSLWLAFEEAWKAETDHSFPPPKPMQRTPESQPVPTESSTYDPEVARKSLQSLRGKTGDGEHVFSVFG